MVAVGIVVELQGIVVKLEDADGIVVKVEGNCSRVGEGVRVAGIVVEVWRKVIVVGMLEVEVRLLPEVSVPLTQSRNDVIITKTAY